MFGDTMGGASDFSSGGGGGAGHQQFFHSSFGNGGGFGGFPGSSGGHGGFGGRSGQAQQQQRQQQAPSGLYDGAQGEITPLTESKFPDKAAKYIWYDIPYAYSITYILFPLLSFTNTYATLYMLLTLYYTNTMLYYARVVHFYSLTRDQATNTQIRDHFIGPEGGLVKKYRAQGLKFGSVNCDKVILMYALYTIIYYSLVKYTHIYFT